MAADEGKGGEYVQKQYDQPKPDRRNKIMNFFERLAQSPNHQKTIKKFVRQIAIQDRG